MVAPVSPGGGDRSAGQLDELDADRVGNADERVEERAGVALFDPAVRGYVDAGPAAHVLLSEVMLLAHATDLLSHLAAAGKDPFVGRGRT